MNSLHTNALDASETAALSINHEAQASQKSQISSYLRELGDEDFFEDNSQNLSMEDLVEKYLSTKAELRKVQHLPALFKKMHKSLNDLIHDLAEKNRRDAELEKRLFNELKEHWIIQDFLLEQKLTENPNKTTS